MFNKGDTTEIWKDIPNYVGIYQVSSLGRVRSLDRVSCNMKFRGKILKGSPNIKGYLGVFLYNGISSRRVNVHRLVALAFLNTIKGKPEINHKDGNKINNKVSNLEWCTRRENVLHSTKTGLNPIGLLNNPNSVPVVQISMDGKFIKEFPSQMEAFRQTGVHNETISGCLKGKYTMSGGFKWKQGKLNKKKGK